MPLSEKYPFRPSPTRMRADGISSRRRAFASSDRLCADRRSSFVAVAFHRSITSGQPLLMHDFGYCPSYVTSQYGFVLRL